MEQFRTYSPEDTILANLDETADRYAALFEQELAHIAEFAQEWLKSRPEDEELISSLSDIGLNASKLAPEQHLAQSMNTLQGMEDLHAVQKNVLLSAEIARHLADESIDLFSMLREDSDVASAVASPYIHYQKNSFTDAAYLCFARLFKDPRANYTHSYQLSCEDVFNGICEYCILPLENTSEGRMIGFIKMIDRYALKILATCEIVGADGSQATRFALLGKQTDLLRSRQPNAPRFFEIACRMEESVSPAEWLIAAKLCKLGAVKLHTIPDENNRGRELCHAVFSLAPDTALNTFLIYLAIKAPQYILIGIYPHLSVTK